MIEVPDWGIPEDHTGDESSRWEEEHGPTFGDPPPPTIKTEFFIAFTEGYDDPITIYGPFESYDAAVQAHFDQAIESGAVEDEFSYPENAYNYYLYDDAVRIARLDRAADGEVESQSALRLLGFAQFNLGKKKIGAAQTLIDKAIVALGGESFYKKGKSHE